MADPKDNYRLYMENALEMLEVARLNLSNDYYGIFTSIEKEQAVADLTDAEEFVQEVTQWLQKKSFL